MQGESWHPKRIAARVSVLTGRRAHAGAGGGHRGPLGAPRARPSAATPHGPACSVTLGSALRLQPALVAALASACSSKCLTRMRGTDSVRRCAVRMRQRPAVSARCAPQVLIGVGGVTSDMGTVRALLAALPFHQFFEGVALGACFNEVRLPASASILLAGAGGTQGSAVWFRCWWMRDVRAVRCCECCCSGRCKLYWLRPSSEAACAWLSVGGLRAMQRAVRHAAASAAS